jgi:hypothetical protein
MIKSGLFVGLRCMLFDQKYHPNAKAERTPGQPKHCSKHVFLFLTHGYLICITDLVSQCAPYSARRCERTPELGQGFWGVPFVSWWWNTI